MKIVAATESVNLIIPKNAKFSMIHPLAATFSMRMHVEKKRFFLYICNYKRPNYHAK